MKQKQLLKIALPHWAGASCSWGAGSRRAGTGQARGLLRRGMGQSGAGRSTGAPARVDVGHLLYPEHWLCVGLDKVWGTQPVWGMAGVGTGPIRHGAQPHWAQGTRRA